MGAEDNALSVKKHSLILENRKKLTVSGVKDVSGFDEQSVVLDTVLGQLTIKGDGLHINKFSIETSELELEGETDSIVYSEIQRSEGGFFTRLFK